MIVRDSSRRAAAGSTLHFFGRISESRMVASSLYNGEVNSYKRNNTATVEKNETKTRKSDTSAIKTARIKKKQ